MTTKANEAQAREAEARAEAVESRAALRLIVREARREARRRCARHPRPEADWIEREAESVGLKRD